MPQSVQDAVKIWSAPAMLLVILTLAGLIWSGQESKIAALESQVAATSMSLTTITANQQNAAQSREEFQSATTRRLDRMEDVLAGVGSALTRLTALQERDAPKP
jgi:hypothetical protein